MIHFKCRCGAGHSVQASVAAQVSRCPVCHASVRLVCGGPAPQEGEFSASLLALAGSLHAGTQLMLGGSVPIEVGKLSGKPLLLPGTLVSRNHCRLVPTDGRWQIVDQGSTNGSYVNGIRIASRDLADGDIVRLGEYEFEFHYAPTAPAPVPPAPAEPADEEPFASFDNFDEPIPIAAASADEPMPAQVDPFAVLNAPAQAAASAAPSPAIELQAIDPADYGSYDLAPAPQPAPPSRELVAGFPAVARVDETSPATAAVKPPLPSPQCPACNRTLTPGAKICVQCGIDVRTGRPIITAQGLDEDQS